MHQLQDKQKYIPWKYNPRSIEYQRKEQFISSNQSNNILVDEDGYGTFCNHTEKRCEIACTTNSSCNEPVGHPTLEYRHKQHQQQIFKHNWHIIQRYSSRYTLTSQSHSESSSPSIISTDFFHPSFSGWIKKPNKSATKLQPKSKLSPASRSRSYIWKFYHQNKNSAEKPAGKLLRWSSSNRGGIIEKKQFDREYRFLRNNNCIKWKQQQQQRAKQIKHIELLFYHAFVKNTLTARKH